MHACTYLSRTLHLALYLLSLYSWDDLNTKVRRLKFVNHHFKRSPPPLFMWAQVLFANGVHDFFFFLIHVVWISFIMRVLVVLLFLFRLDRLYKVWIFFYDSRFITHWMTGFLVRKQNFKWLFCFFLDLVDYIKCEFFCIVWELYKTEWVNFS